MMMQNRIVIDTTSLIGTARHDSIPMQAFRAARDGYTLVQSNETIDELLNVINRRKLLDRYGAASMRQLVRDVAEISKFIAPVPRLDPLKADVNDTKFLELAAASGAKPSSPAISTSLR